MTSPRTGNLRIVLLCAALIFQVLTFAKHTGVSFLGVQDPPKAGVGFADGPGDSPLADGVGDDASTAAATYSSGSSAFTSSGTTGSGARLVAAVGTSRPGSGPGGALDDGEAEPNDLPASPGAPLPSNPRPTPSSSGPTASEQRAGEEPAPKPPSSGGPGSPGPHTLDFERVDLMPKISTGGSEAESTESCFTSMGLIESDDPGIEINLPSFGKVACVHEWDFREGPIGKSVTAEADLHLSSSSSGGEFNVCAVVTYEEGEEWPTEESCQEINRGLSGGAIHVSLTQDAHSARVQQAYFTLEAFADPLTITVTGPHLFIEQAKGSWGPREN